MLSVCYELPAGPVLSCCFGVLLRVYLTLEDSHLPPQVHLHSEFTLREESPQILVVWKKNPKNCCVFP